VSIVDDGLAQAKAELESGDYKRGFSYLKGAARVAIAQGKTDELQEVIRVAAAIAGQSGNSRLRVRSEDLVGRVQRRPVELDDVTSDGDGSPGAALGKPGASDVQTVVRALPAMANRRERIRARSIDYLLLGGPFVLVGLIEWPLVGYDSGAVTALIAVSLMPLLVGPFLYFAPFEQGRRGQTLGMRRVGIAVRTPDGARVGYWRAVAREYRLLTRVLPGWGWYFININIFFNDNDPIWTAPVVGTVVIALKAAGDGEVL
jgi:uncharacterized RDD family membrane protein YckC